MAFRAAIKWYTKYPPPSKWKWTPFIGSGTLGFTFGSTRLIKDEETFFDRMKNGVLVSTACVVATPLVIRVPILKNLVVGDGSWFVTIASGGFIGGALSEYDSQLNETDLSKTFLGGISFAAYCSIIFPLSICSSSLLFMCPDDEWGIPNSINRYEIIKTILLCP